MKYEELFRPIKIGNIEIKNRIVMSPMALCDAHPPGYPSEQTKAVFAARAKGGAGLIIMGGTLSTRIGWETCGGHNYRIDVPGTLGAMCEVAERVHAYGTKCFVQLMQCLGRQGTSRNTGVQPVSCTAEAYSTAEEDLPEGMKFPGGLAGELPRELTVSEIEALEDEEADSAIRAVAAGFDGIEIPCHHGYLALSFLSPRINKRNDLYGGGLENRIRFILNTVRKTRDRIGPDFPLGVRLCAAEHVEGGLTCNESVEAAKILEKEGIDFVDLADGVYEKHKYISPEADGTLLEHGEPQAFKKALNIPVIIPSIHDPDMAEAAVRNGSTDMVALGRQLLADPDWANKVKEGKVDSIVKCDRDNKCIMRFFFGLPVRCPLNPNLGRERFMPEYYQPPFEG